jgi:hypothetical protein
VLLNAELSTLRSTAAEHERVPSSQLLVWPRCAGVDPILEQRDLLRGELLAFGGHDLLGVGAGHALDQWTRTALAWDNRRLPRIAAAQRIGSLVQAETVLLLLRPVALDAAFGEDWLDVAPKFDGAWLR